VDPRVPVRNASVKGPLDPGGDWLVDKGVKQTLAIASVPRSGDVTYEIVNFIDGIRTVGDIRDAVSAEFEPVDLKIVAEYVDALASAGAVTFKR
jgi:aminopeptidase YwaD